MNLAIGVVGNLSFTVGCCHMKDILNTPRSPVDYFRIEYISFDPLDWQFCQITALGGSPDDSNHTGTCRN
jgi:hypothetical protein